MNCLQQNSATRRYLYRFVPTMAAYAVALLFAEWAHSQVSSHWRDAVRAGCAAGDPDHRNHRRGRAVPGRGEGRVSTQPAGAVDAVGTGRDPVADVGMGMSPVVRARSSLPAIHGVSPVLVFPGDCNGRAALEVPMKNRLRVLRAETGVVAGRPGRAAGGVAPVGQRHRDGEVRPIAAAGVPHCAAVREQHRGDLHGRRLTSVA